jgi:hypothetical protein
MAAQTRVFIYLDSPHEWNGPIPGFWRFRGSPGDASTSELTIAKEVKRVVIGL